MQGHVHAKPTHACIWWLHANRAPLGQVADVVRLSSLKKCLEYF